jgi:hypothetical protein
LAEEHSRVPPATGIRCISTNGFDPVFYFETIITDMDLVFNGGRSVPARLQFNDIPIISAHCRMPEVAFTCYVG